MVRRTKKTAPARGELGPQRECRSRETGTILMWFRNPPSPIKLCFRIQEWARDPQSWVAALTKGPYQRPPFRRSFLLPGHLGQNACQLTGPISSGLRIILSGTEASFAKTTAKLSNKPRRYSKVPRLSFGAARVSSPGSVTSRSEPAGLPQHSPSARPANVGGPGLSLTSAFNIETEPFAFPDVVWIDAC